MQPSFSPSTTTTMNGDDGQSTILSLSLPPSARQSWQHRSTRAQPAISISFFG
jgi:hypothetical protein